MALQAYDLSEIRRDFEIGDEQEFDRFLSGLCKINPKVPDDMIFVARGIRAFFREKGMEYGGAVECETDPEIDERRNVWFRIRTDVPTLEEKLELQHELVNYLSVGNPMFIANVLVKVV